MAKLRAQSDNFPAEFESIARSLIAGDASAAREVLYPIEYPPRELPARISPSRAQRIEIFRRDSFHCRYFAGKTILTPVMELIGVAFPDQFPFESDGWRGGVTHPAIVSRSPMVDHVDPVARGGDSLDPDNLVTACNPCNAIKSDFTLQQLGWELQPISSEPWDGLAGLYVELWKAVGEPRESRHLSWIRDLGLLGSVAPKQKTTMVKREWSRNSLLEDLAARGEPRSTEALQKLLVLLDVRVDFSSVVTGGNAEGSLKFGINRPVEFYPFAAYSYGSIEVKFQNIKARSPLDLIDLRMELLGRLNSIAGIRLSKDRIDKRPSFPLSAIAGSREFDEFVAVLDWSITQVVESAGALRVFPNRDR